MRAADLLDTMPQCRQTEEAFVCVLSKFSKMVALFSGGTSQELELPIRVTEDRFARDANSATPKWDFCWCARCPAFAYENKVWIS